MRGLGNNLKWIKRKPKSNINQGDGLLSKLANIRGIHIDEVDDFLAPAEWALNPASDLKNGLEASERIKQAIDNDERIVVSADNDADGVTSTAIMIRYLRERIALVNGVEPDLDGNVHVNIPYIFAERDWGHGIKEQLRYEEDNDERNTNAGHNRAVVEEADLLIIVDSSSNDVDTIDKIVNEIGTDVIVLDHHAINDHKHTVNDVGGILVNPQQRGCRYVNKDISGAVVVWKIVGLIEELYDDGLIDTDKYIDLAGIGLYADMMDMSVLENRYIVQTALLNINNMGLERILKSAKGVNMNRLDGDTIGFTIGPLINGTARMGNIQDAIELLLSDEDKEVKRIRLRMHRANEKRKEIQREMTEKLSQDIDTTGKMIFIITDESTSGMNGLVAQNIAQQYQRPVFIGRKDDNGFVSGSARSYNGIKLKTFFSESGLVEFASGHEGALGIGFHYENFDEILNYVALHMEDVKVRERTLFYDIDLDVSEVEEAIDMIEAFNHITGLRCPKILVRVDGIMVEDRKVIGSMNNTVKFSTMDNLDLIKFRVDEEYAEDVGIMDTISVVGELKWNEWTKFRPVYEVIRTMQIMIEDYRLEE